MSPPVLNMSGYLTNQSENLSAQTGDNAAVMRDRFRVIHRLPLLSLDCAWVRSHSVISSCNSVFLFPIVSDASGRLSSAIRPAIKYGPTDFLGFSKNPMAVPLWPAKQS